MLIETDNASDTMDPSIEMLLPTLTSMKIFLMAEQSLLRRTLSTMSLAFCGFNSFVHSSDIVVTQSDSSHLPLEKIFSIPRISTISNA